MNKQTCTVCPNGEHISKPINKEEFIKHAEAFREQDWEIEFDEFFNEDGFSTSGEEVKQFIRKHDKEVREQEREKIEHLENQIDRLATFLMENYMDRITEGSAVDVAIKILQDNKPEE